MKYLAVCIFLVSLFSCKSDTIPSVNNKKITCETAVITKIIGKNRFFGFNNNITIFYAITSNEKEILKRKLVIDAPFLGESFTPFKTGDKVMVKYYENNIVKMYLLESVNDKTGYKWESPYTFEEACSGNFPKEISFSAISSEGRDSNSSE